MFLDKNKLDAFIYKLIEYPCTFTIDNQYKNKLQVNNLKMYLENMSLLKPNILLVGEAPGYKGCAITGVPFTSEYIINSCKSFDIFKGCIVKGNKKEPTATMVWDALIEKEKEGKLLIKPLMWNIFPFHPINNGCISTNRRPTSKESELGLKILYELLELFPSIEKIYAIGGAASDKLKNHPKFISTLRHPSNGGKKKFKEGIDTIYR